MSTEVGGSSTAGGIDFLATDITKMVQRPNQEFSIGCLINVPHHLRKLDEQAFTPLLISIGPIHCFNAKLQTTKKLKAEFCELFINRPSLDLSDIIYRIKLREKEIRSYYVEAIVSSISSDDFVRMIVVDGMFILAYILRECNPNMGWDGPTIEEWMPHILKFDLVLLENQLPFFVLDMLLKMLLEQANFPDDFGLESYSLRELAFQFFECYNFQRMDLQNFNGKMEHFTDLVRLFYLREQLPCRKFGGAKLSYSATQLHEVGVKFKGVEFKGVNLDEGRGVLDMRFDSKNAVLEIPCIMLNDERVRLIRNIIALEQSLYVGHAYVTDFFVILDFLIDTSKDVDLLCDKGILVNYLGDSNAAASAFNSLNTNISWDYMNIEYLKICDELNKFYKVSWNRYRTTLWRQYFSTPWRAVSTSAAIMLLLLTAIQAVCSLKSTKW